MFTKRALASALAVAAMAAGSTAVASAQQPGLLLLTWNGKVDREIQVTMRGDNATTADIGLNETGKSRITVANPLPRSEGDVSVKLENGRGDADVVQQPTAENGFTTIIRIRDKSKGADNYRMSVYWQGMAAAEIASRHDAMMKAMTGAHDGVGQLHWTGNVDDNVRLVIHGSTLDLRTLTGKSPTDARSSFTGSPLPAREAHVRVTLVSGRGNVFVEQQPDAENGFTTIIRISDPPGGYGFYDFNVNWY